MQFSAFERYRHHMQMPPVEVIAEEQSSDYESGRVQIGTDTWRIRTARITPTKPGAFVAVWARGSTGDTRPFSSADQCAGLLVFVPDQSRFGVFTFPRERLLALGILQSPRAPGKRGFRVYPSWSVNLNDQARDTQRVQAANFVDLPCCPYDAKPRRA